MAIEDLSSTQRRQWRSIARNAVVVLVTVALALSVVGPVTAVTALDGADSAQAGTGNGQPQVATGGQWTTLASQSPVRQTSVSEHKREAAENATEDALDLLQRQGVSINQSQRAAAVNGTVDAVAQHQDATVEQVQNASYGAVRGTFLQSQNVSVTQVQNATLGAASGALSQHQNASATQLQHAAHGAAHGAVSQSQNVTVTQLQVVARGAGAGAAHEAGKHDDEGDAAHPGAIREAAQGAAVGALVQHQNVSVEQRQAAAVGAAEGALNQSQSVTVNQTQRASVKEIQVAAIGAAEGAVAATQRQNVTVEQVQAAARGACRGALRQTQSVRITQIQEAAFGAATGSLTQSQDASVTQIQAAADGAAHGALVQRQSVSVTQVQYAAAGAAEGAVSSAVQQQIVQIEMIQAAARGASEGAVTQVQTVDVTQIQGIAAAGSSGSLRGVTQVQTVDVRQVQSVASGATESGVQMTQTVTIEVEQILQIVEQSAGDSVVFVVENDVDDEDEAREHSAEDVEADAEEREDEEPRPTANVSVADQTTDGEAIIVQSASLEVGGFLAVYDAEAWAAGTAEPLGVTDFLESGEHGDVSVALDDPLESDDTLVVVAHRDTDDDESFDYGPDDRLTDYPYRTDALTTVRDAADVTVETEEPEPEGSLAVSDQQGNGSQFTVTSANATVEYVVQVDYGEETTRTDAFEAGDAIENETVALDPSIEDDGPVNVTLRATETDEVLANQTAQYELVEPPNGTLTVANQSGNGTAFVVENASATVDYALEVEYDAGTTTAEFDANETLANETLTLDPPIEDDGTVNVTLRATETDEVLANQTVQYDVVEPSANVTFADQPVEDGAVTVAAANLSDGGFLALHANSTNATDDVIGVSPYLQPGAHENVTVPLDADLAADATVNATAHLDTNGNQSFDFTTTDSTADATYANETGFPVADEALVTVETGPGPGVEYLNCTTVRVNGTYDSLGLELGYYDTDGNQTSDQVLTGADVPGERPVDGTTLVTVGETDEITEREDGTLVVQVADEGAFGEEAGSFVASVNATQSPDGDADLAARNPDAATCRAAVQPDAPTLDVESVEVVDNETALVNLTYENPNDAPLTPAASLFANGTVAADPPATLEPGAAFAVVEWTPQSANESVEWNLNLSNFDLPNESVSGPTAGEVEGLLEPPADDTETPAPTPNDTETPNETETPTPNETETPAPTDTPTQPPADTPTPTETPTEAPADTPIPTETVTTTEAPADTPIPTETVTTTEGPADTPVTTETPTSTPTDTPSPDEADTPTATATATPSPTATAEPDPAETASTETDAPALQSGGDASPLGLVASPLQGAIGGLGGAGLLVAVAAALVFRRSNR